MLAVCGNTPITLTASGKTGVASCERPEDGVRTLRLLLSLMRFKKVIQNFHELCSSQRISWTFELCNRPVFRLGYIAKPGPLSKLLGIYPVEVSTLQLCTALLESSRSGLK